MEGWRGAFWKTPLKGPACRDSDLNRKPPLYKSGALPIELSRLVPHGRIPRRSRSQCRFLDLSYAALHEDTMCERAAVQKAVYLGCSTVAQHHHTTVNATTH